MNRLAMAALAGIAATPLQLMAQTAPQAANSDAEIQALVERLETLKSNYALEVRRLRELDMQVQAMQARLNKTSGEQSSPQDAAGVEQSAPPARQAAPEKQASEGYASTAEEAKSAQDATRRSVDDVKQQQAALFNRRLTIENGVTYARYDRKQLTLNGFLALDAIFLGNIAIENVESDALTYNFATRWGINPRLTLNLDAPYLARKTVYQKGGAGGSAAATAQEDSFGAALGDISLSANYKLLPEQGWRPEMILTGGITVPTGVAPYGLDWTVIERDDDDFIRFAVPAEQPTGNGLWQANLGLSMVKTADPAILFGNIGYIHSFAREFDDIDSSPDTVNPGEVKLGRSLYFGAGVAFAFNERTSLSISFSDRLSARAATRYVDGEWLKVIGSDANIGTLNLGVTYALSPQATIVSMLGIGLTPDAPDFSLTLKVPYSL